MDELASASPAFTVLIIVAELIISLVALRLATIGMIELAFVASGADIAQEISADVTFPAIRAAIFVIGHVWFFELMSTLSLLCQCFNVTYQR